jgi:two-component system response regulator
VILLVEDDDDDADLMMRALRRLEVADPVERACDGVQALNYLTASGTFLGRDRSEVPKLVLLDLKLPRCSGFDVLRALKADAVHRHVPVVVLTSSLEQRDLDTAYALGANSYVQKPVEFESFVAAVDRIGSYWLDLNRTPPSRPVEAAGTR